MWSGREVVRVSEELAPSFSVINQSVGYHYISCCLRRVGRIVNITRISAVRDADVMSRVFCKLPRFYRIAWHHVPQESCCHIFFSFLSFCSSFFLSSPVCVSLLRVQEQVCIIQAKEVIKSLAVCIAYGSDCTSITKCCECIVIGLETW